MPFTPFHLGPGLVFKAIGGRHVSFMVFGGAQVMMDIEPLVGIVRNWPVLHGYTHTLLGALVIGAAAGIIGRPISAWVLQRLKIPHAPFTWFASFAGAFLGTFSHVLLDAVMHSDMAPWWPLATGNPLLGLVDIDHLHIACVVCAFVGAPIAWLRLRAGNDASTAAR